MINELYFPNNLGGTETCLQRTCEGLREKGENVFVICTSPNIENIEIDVCNGVKVYRMKTDNFYSIVNASKMPFYLKILWLLKSQISLQSYQKVKMILSQEKPDIVHTHNLYTLSPLVFQAIKELEIPLIHELHDYNLLCPKATLFHYSGKVCKNSRLCCKVYRHLKNQFIKFKPNIVIAPSQFIIDKHKESGFFKDIIYKRIPHGVPLPETIGVKDYHTLNLLYVGNLSKHKGIHILIQAFKQVNRCDIHLDVCGRGKSEGEYRKLAQGNKRIRFHGFVSKKKLNQLYDTANVLIVPSIWYDNSPTVIYEAFVHGIPVIGSRIGGIPELVHNGENGFLYEPRNEKQLVEILNVISPSILYSLEKKISRESYGIKNYIGELHDFYKGILGGSFNKL